MAGRGPVPKPPDARHGHRSKADLARLVVLEGRKVAPPELPKISEFDQRTLDWWQAWVDSPQAEQFTATDWQRLLLVARLVDQFVRGPRPALLGEIRLNEAALGATVADRLRLGVRVTPSGPDTGAAGTSANRIKVRDELRAERERRVR
jgi:hypothetical protein